MNLNHGGQKTRENQDRPHLQATGSPLLTQDPFQASEGLS